MQHTPYPAPSHHDVRFVCSDGLHERGAARLGEGRCHREGLQGPEDRCQEAGCRERLSPLPVRRQAGNSLEQ
eukprot:1402239-Alexandrium_andersonii.AAC.1